MNNQQRNKKELLWMAVLGNNAKEVKKLLDTLVFSQETLGFMLATAAQHGLDRIIYLLIGKGAKVQKDELDGAKGVKTFKVLLKNGANINFINEEGNTRLLSEVKLGNNIKFIKFLVENGANLNIRDNQHMSPYDIAVYKYENGYHKGRPEQLEIVKYLQKKQLNTALRKQKERRVNKLTKNILLNKSSLGQDMEYKIGQYLFGKKRKTKMEYIKNPDHPYGKMPYPGYLYFTTTKGTITNVIKSKVITKYMFGGGIKLIRKDLKAIIRWMKSHKYKNKVPAINNALKIAENKWKKHTSSSFGKKKVPCTRSSLKKYKTRPSPPFPAVPCKGRVYTGNDGNKWISQKRGNNLNFRWYKLK
jgi:hypothetical protein